MASATSAVRCLVLAATFGAAAGYRQTDAAGVAGARDEAAFEARSREVLDLLNAPSADREHVDQKAPRSLADRMPRPKDVPRCFGNKWTYTGKMLGHGMVGSVWVVKGRGGEEYAMKGMRLRPKGMEQRIARGIVPTLGAFADEVAAQTLAAEMHLAPRVVDYFLCRHPSRPFPTLGFIVMQLVRGPDLGAYASEQGPEAGVWCQQKYLPPVSSIKGFITGAMYQNILDGVSRLDQAGIYITDLHPSNIMVEKEGDMERVLFIDFGFVSKCTYKARQAWLFTLFRLGCPVREDLLAPSDGSKLLRRDNAMLKSNGWWHSGFTILAPLGNGTYKVEGADGVIRDHVPRADLFREGDPLPECMNRDGSDSEDDSFDFGLIGNEDPKEEDPFREVLADIRRSNGREEALDEEDPFTEVLADIRRNNGPEEALDEDFDSSIGSTSDSDSDFENPFLSD